MPRPRILLTGFGPFAGLPLNPSGEIVRLIEQDGAGDIELICRVLPVSHRAVPVLVHDLVAEHRPDAALGLGVAIGAPVVRVETAALNRTDFRVADADGVVSRGMVDPVGPPARFATYPAEQVLAAVRGAGVPAVLSHHAGTHLCNLTLYALLGALPATAPCGFLHLPLFPEQVVAMMETAGARQQTAPFAPTDLPSMEAGLQRRAVAAALGCLAAAVAG